ncbi:hypothetical protein DFJ73DRAFT_806612 [Zopfochytrium polystomum]|nr:hypothetical protein DFJ73DRAFT_806612 [Zopfochytrium polystomum]
MLALFLAAVLVLLSSSLQSPARPTGTPSTISGDKESASSTIAPAHSCSSTERQSLSSQSRGTQTSSQTRRISKKPTAFQVRRYLEYLLLESGHRSRPARKMPLPTPPSSTSSSPASPSGAITSSTSAKHALLASRLQQRQNAPKPAAKRSSDQGYSSKKHSPELSIDVHSTGMLATAPNDSNLNSTRLKDKNREAPTPSTLEEAALVVQLASLNQLLESNKLPRLPDALACNPPTAKTIAETLSIVRSYVAGPNISKSSFILRSDYQALRARCEKLRKEHEERERRLAEVEKRASDAENQLRDAKDRMKLLEREAARLRQELVTATSSPQQTPCHFPTHFPSSCPECGHAFNMRHASCLTPPPSPSPLSSQTRRNSGQSVLSSSSRPASPALSSRTLTSPLPRPPTPSRFASIPYAHSKTRPSTPFSPSSKHHRDGHPASPTCDDPITDTEQTTLAGEDEVSTVESDGDSAVPAFEEDSRSREARAAAAAASIARAHALAVKTPAAEAAAKCAEDKAMYASAMAAIAAYRKETSASVVPVETPSVQSRASPSHGRASSASTLTRVIEESEDEDSPQEYRLPPSRKGVRGRFTSLESSDGSVDTSSDDGDSHATNMIPKISTAFEGRNFREVGAQPSRYRVCRSSCIKRDSRRTPVASKSSVYGPGENGKYATGLGEVRDLSASKARHDGGEDCGLDEDWEDVADDTDDDEGKPDYILPSSNCSKQAERSSGEKDSVIHGTDSVHSCATENEARLTSDFARGRPLGLAREKGKLVSESLGQPATTGVLGKLPGTVPRSTAVGMRWAVGFGMGREAGRIGMVGWVWPFWAR